MLGITQIATADLEQAYGRCATIEVAARSRDQARQKRGTHHLQLFTDGVGEAPFRATERLSFLFGDAAPPDRCVEPARRGCAPKTPFEELRTGRRCLGYPGGAVERRRRHFVIAFDSGDFLD